MSKKYVGQVNSTNFVYPNATIAEYDQTIIHDINNNMVSGNVTNIVAVFANNNESINLSLVN